MNCATALLMKERSSVRFGILFSGKIKRYTSTYALLDYYEEKITYLIAVHMI